MKDSIFFIKEIGYVVECIEVYMLRTWLTHVETLLKSAEKADLMSHDFQFKDKNMLSTLGCERNFNPKEVL